MKSVFSIGLVSSSGSLLLAACLRRISERFMTLLPHAVRYSPPRLRAYQSWHTEWSFSLVQKTRQSPFVPLASPQHWCPSTNTMLTQKGLSRAARHHDFPREGREAPGLTSRRRATCCW